MKQYLAVEPMLNDAGEVVGYNNLVFCEEDDGQAEMFVRDYLLPDSEFCGEITLSNVVRQSDLALPCDPEPLGA